MIVGQKIYGEIDTSVLVCGKRHNVIYIVAIFSSPGLCPWKAYVVIQLLASASASASAQCLSFQRCA